jgi:hypothetical protein
MCSGSRLTLPTLRVLEQNGIIEIDVNLVPSKTQFPSAHAWISPPKGDRDGRRRGREALAARVFLLILSPELRRKQQRRPS